MNQIVDALYRLKRWMYRTGRPGLLAKALNAVTSFQFRAGLGAKGWIVLEVRGRKSGRVIAFPLASVEEDGERYLVAMLGERTNWVRNVRAANGQAVLVRNGRQVVRLVELPVRERAPIIARYVDEVPGGRPHIPVDKDAPLAEYEAIAGEFPVFRVVPD